jgi:single-stranded DNA-binding protein
MIDALITGTLFKQAEARQSKAGKTFVTAKLTVADADQQRQFVNLIAFREPVCDALLALNAGDSVAVTGPLKVSTWTDKNGETRISYDLTAEGAMTLYAVRKKRNQTQQSEQQDAGHQPRQPAGDFPDFGEL